MRALIREVTDVKPKWNVIVVGGIDSDYLIRGKTLPPPGQTVEGEVFLEGPGGKGANQAVGAARLGARVAIVGRVGLDSRGEAIVEYLRRERVGTQYIVHDEHVETGAALIMLDHRGQKQILTVPGANAELTMYDVLRAERAIRTARVLLVQLEVPIGAVEEALRIARAYGLRTILDPAPPRLLEKSILQKVDLIKPNAQEAEILTGIKVIDRSTARLAADRLLCEGVQAVAIQAGGEGNLLVWPGGEYWFPKIPLEAIDATGAGDAFAGALAFGLAAQKSLVDTVRIANAAAALRTTKLGSQAALAKMHEVQNLLAKQAA